MSRTKRQTVVAENQTDINAGDRPIGQRDINAAAWAACDTFRGVVDPAQYKDYILVILFLRYISDVWQDHYDEYKKEYGDDDERIRRKLERERFVLPVITITEETDEYEKDKKTKKRRVVDTFTASFYSLYDRRDRPNMPHLARGLVRKSDAQNVRRKHAELVHQKGEPVGKRARLAAARPRDHADEAFRGSDSLALTIIQRIKKH